MTPPPAIQQPQAVHKPVHNICLQLADREIYEKVDYQQICDVVGRDNLLIRQIDDQLKLQKGEAHINVPICDCGSAACQLKEFEMFVQLLRAGHFSWREPTVHMARAIQQVIEHYQLTALNQAL